MGRSLQEIVLSLLDQAEEGELTALVPLADLLERYEAKGEHARFLIRSGRRQLAGEPLGKTFKKRLGQARCHLHGYVPERG